jgi:hypothetical protein
MLKGTLQDFTLPEILRLISSAQRTGRLTVTRNGCEVDVFFHEGAVCRAQHSRDRPRVGAGGDVSSDLEGAAELTAIEDCVCELMGWESGEFSWEGRREAEPDAVFRVTIEGLIAEGARRLAELELLKQKIPSPGSVLAMAPAPPQGADEVKLNDSEWRILALVDGDRSVGEIGALANLDDLSSARVLSRLVSAGLVEVVTPHEPSPAVSDDTAPPEPRELYDIEAVALLEEIQLQGEEAPPADHGVPAPRIEAVTEYVAGLEAELAIDASPIVETVAVNGSEDEVERDSERVNAAAQAETFLAQIGHEEAQRSLDPSEDLTSL